MGWIASTPLFIAFFLAWRGCIVTEVTAVTSCRGPSERSDSVRTVGQDDGGHCGIGKPSPVATARGEDLVGSVGSSGDRTGSVTDGRRDGVILLDISRRG